LAKFFQCASDLPGQDERELAWSEGRHAGADERPPRRAEGETGLFESLLEPAKTPAIENITIRQNKGYA